MLSVSVKSSVHNREHINKRKKDRPFFPFFKRESIENVSSKKEIERASERERERERNIEGMKPLPPSPPTPLPQPCLLCDTRPRNGLCWLERGMGSVGASGIESSFGSLWLCRVVATSIYFPFTIFILSDDKWCRCFRYCPQSFRCWSASTQKTADGHFWGAFQPI